MIQHKQKWLFILLLILGYSFLIPGCATSRRAEVDASWGEYDLERGNYKEAIEFFTDALERPAENRGANFSLSKTYVNRGFAYAALTLYADAVKDFDKALEYDPKNPVAYQNRGFVYAKLQNYQQAEADLDKAIELAPDYAAAYFTRGQLHELKADWALALQDYKKAFELATQRNAMSIARGITVEQLRQKIHELERRHCNGIPSK